MMIKINATWTGWIDQMRGKGPSKRHRHKLVPVSVEQPLNQNWKEDIIPIRAAHQLWGQDWMCKRNQAQHGHLDLEIGSRHNAKSEHQNKPKVGMCKTTCFYNQLASGCYYAGHIHKHGLVTFLQSVHIRHVLSFKNSWKEIDRLRQNEKRRDATKLKFWAKTNIFGCTWLKTK